MALHANQQEVNERGTRCNRYHRLVQTTVDTAWVCHATARKQGQAEAVFQATPTGGQAIANHDFKGLGAPSDRDLRAPSGQYPKRASMAATTAPKIGT
jgi:hypothetical protein